MPAQRPRRRLAGMVSVRSRVFTRLSVVLLGITPCGVVVAQQARSGPSYSLPPVRVSVSCSAERPGTAAATVRWSVKRAPLDSSRLQVTVYRNGFARGMYALFAVKGKKPLVPQFSDSSPHRDLTLPAYRLRAVRVPSSADTAAFRVDGLEDGITYYWRLAHVKSQTPAPGPAVRVDAPTCPGLGKPGRG